MVARKSGYVFLGAWIDFPNTYHLHHVNQDIEGAIRMQLGSQLYLRFESKGQSVT